MRPGQVWKHQDYSKIQLPRGRIDPKSSQFGFGHLSQQNPKAHSKGIKQQSFLGDSWHKAALLMRGRHSHLQSFHSSRYVFLRQDVTCHISWCRLENEDAVMGQGFVSHATLGPGKEGRMSGQCTGYITHTTSPGQKDDKEARVGCIMLNFRSVHV